jgi:hypothetical protein
MHKLRKTHERQLELHINIDEGADRSVTEPLFYSREVYKQQTLTANKSRVTPSPIFKDLQCGVCAQLCRLIVQEVFLP